MGKYKPYPEYKDSGVEWNKEIPAGWCTKQVAFILKDGNEGMKIGPFGSALKLEDMVEKGIKVYGQENVIKKDFQLGKRKISFDKADEMKVYAIRQGDLLVTMMGTSGCCEVVPSDAEYGIIDSHLLRVRPNDELVTSCYLCRLLNESVDVAYQVAILGKGSIMHGLNSGIVKSLKIFLPPKEEQTQIAAFLDHETAKIDRLIEKQEKLIELLKEKRQAVISHAVTKGLNPDAPMKDSGVEWLGEVPEHWEVKRVKRIIEFVTSGSRGWAQYYADSGALFFRIANLNRDSLKLKLRDIQYVNPPQGAEGERSRIREGDLLISITADLGSTAVATNDVVGGYVSQHVALARPLQRNVVSDYLGYCLLSEFVKNQFKASGYGGTKIQLSLEDIKELIVAIPSKDEQQLVVAEINRALAKYDGLIKRAQVAIALLQERRTALISAAVTGKIDVRDWNKD